MAARPTPEPYAINVADDVLDDLQRRLEATRWSIDLDNEDGKYGVSTTDLRSLVEYWITDYDWRAAEVELNRFSHYRAVVDGNPVHFIHQRGTGPDPIPVILTHGWPWTFWDWSKVIRPLADPVAHGGEADASFDVVVPSLPGFGFSTPARGDINFWRIADQWHTLMTEVLGYERYAASGADYGQLVTAQLGHKYADELYGVHLTQAPPLTIFGGDRPWDMNDGASKAREDADPDDRELRLAVLEMERRYFAHITTHMLDAQTLTHGLNDSPAGMLAWLLQRWRDWSDMNGDFDRMFPRDHLLTNATIYWVSQTVGQSLRIYPNTALHRWRPSHDRTPPVEAPTGFTFLCGEPFPPGATVDNRVEMFRTSSLAPWYNTVYAKAYADGGHFAAWENPEAIVADIRELFTSLRARV